MALPYERIEIPGTPPEVLDKFYEYVDIISALFFHERVNPLTGIPYCPNNDQTYRVSPLYERRWGGDIDPHVLKNIYYIIQYTVPFQERLNGPIQQNVFQFHIDLQLKFSTDEKFINSNIWISVQARQPGMGYQSFNMKIWDLNSRQEIIDGFRIFMGTFINFYVLPWEGHLQHLKIAHLLKDYDERHARYIHFIREEYRTEMAKLLMLRFRRSPMHGIPSSVVTEYFIEPILKKKTELLRDLSMNGVPNIVQATAVAHAAAL